MNLVALFVAEHGINATVSDIRSTARTLERKAAPNTLTPELETALGRVFGLPDPTPREAFRNIARNDACAARRLGLVTA